MPYLDLNLSPAPNGRLKGLAINTPSTSLSLIMEFQKLPPLKANYAEAITLIDEAHARDPNKIPSPDGSRDIPYELHYAQEMTRWLAERCPDASPTLQIACRAQHFRRWALLTCAPGPSCETTLANNGRHPAGRCPATATP